MRHLWLWVGLLTLIGSGAAQAATLNVVNGQLMGASGVLVDGSLYDVEFLDGTCIDLYNGCDDVSDFTFQTSADAGLASQALLGQVFLDVAAGSFDSVPSLTNGCSDPYGCEAITPFAFAPSYHPLCVNCNAYVRKVWNSDTSHDLAYNDTLRTQVVWESTAVDRWEQIQVFAVWSPVPEPTTALLLGLGLTGLSMRRRSAI